MLSNTGEPQYKLISYWCWSYSLVWTDFNWKDTLILSSITCCKYQAKAMLAKAKAMTFLEYLTQTLREWYTQFHIHVSFQTLYNSTIIEKYISTEKLSFYK